MKRRDSIKTLLVGGVASATIATTACKTDSDGTEEIVELKDKGYGRTEAEKLYDEKIEAEICLVEHELNTIATLCDLILPATESAGSATDAGVPEFIDFIVKDLPTHQLPIQGGLMWLDGESNQRYEKQFIDCSLEQQKSILDDIAYPDEDGTSPQLNPGRSFFSRLRNLTLTGYYTTKMGIDDLGYVGNRPNLWDGVPQEVLDKHGLDYPEDWKSKFVNHETRDEAAIWDDSGNLLN